MFCTSLESSLPAGRLVCRALHSSIRPVVVALVFTLALISAGRHTTCCTSVQRNGGRHYDEHLSRSNWSCTGHKSTVRHYAHRKGGFSSPSRSVPSAAHEAWVMTGQAGQRAAGHARASERRGRSFRLSAGEYLNGTSLRYEGFRREPCGCVVGLLKNTKNGRAALYAEFAKSDCVRHPHDYIVCFGEGPSRVGQPSPPISAARPATTANAADRLRGNIRRRLRERGLTQAGLANAAAKSRPWASAYVGQGR